MGGSVDAVCCLCHSAFGYRRLSRRNALLAVSAGATGEGAVGGESQPGKALADAVVGGGVRVELVG